MVETLKQPRLNPALVQRPLPGEHVVNLPLGQLVPARQIAGVAAGYDFDLGSTAFVGGEVSADKILTDDTKVAFGFTGRLGAKLGEKGKFYGLGGYSTEACDLCEDSWTAGVGYEHGFGKNLYGKVEYRHYFVDNGIPDADAVAVGLGMKF